MKIFATSSCGSVHAVLCVVRSKQHRYRIAEADPPHGSVSVPNRILARVFVPPCIQSQGADGVKRPIVVPILVLCPGFTPTFVEVHELERRDMSGACRWSCRVQKVQVQRVQSPLKASTSPESTPLLLWRFSPLATPPRPVLPPPCMYQLLRRPAS